VALAGGGFVVTWHGVRSNIEAQVFDANGQPEGDKILVSPTVYLFNTTTPAQVAPLADGGFVVTWVDSTHDNSSLAIKAQEFDAAGTKQGAEILVNGATLGIVPNDFVQTN